MRISSILVTLGTIASAVAQWFLVWMFARTHGSIGVGTYTLLYSIATPIFVLVQLGLRPVYITIAPRMRFTLFVKLRIAGCATGALAFLAVSASLSFSARLVGAITLLKVADSALDIWYAKLQSDGKLGSLGALLIANALGTIALAALVIHISNSIALAVVMSAVTSVLTLIYSLVYSRRQRSAGAETSAARHEGRYRTIFMAAVPVVASQSLASIVAYLPIWIASTGGTADAGVFATALYLVVFANLLGSSLQTVQLPRYRDIEARGEACDWLVTKESVGWLAVGLCGVVIAISAGGPLLRLVYGPEFFLSRLDIGLIALGSAFVVPSYLLNTLLLVRNMYTLLLGITATAVGLAAVTGILLVGVIAPVTAASATACVAGFTRLVGGAAGLRMARPRQLEPTRAL